MKPYLSVTWYTSNAGSSQGSIWAPSSRPYNNHLYSIYNKTLVSLLNDNNRAIFTSKGRAVFRNDSKMRGHFKRDIKVYVVK